MVDTHMVEEPRRGSLWETAHDGDGVDVSLSHVVREMADAFDELAAEILRQVWGTPGYDDEHMHPQDLSERVLASLRWTIESLESGDRPAPAAIEAARAIGISRALQGVPVDAVIQSWATAERIILDRLLDRMEAMTPAELRTAVRRLGAVLGELSRYSVEAYRETQSGVTAHYDRLATDLVARLSGEEPAAPGEIDRRARTIGSDPGLPHTAVVLGMSGTPAAHLRVQRHLLAAVAARTQARILVGSLDEWPLLLIPVPGDDLAGLRATLESALADRRRPDPCILGLGGRTARLHEIGPVCREAGAAADVARRLGLSDRVVGFGEVVPEVMLLRSPDASRLLAERVRPLRERPELLATLRAYLANGMSARAAARSLYVHQNTVPQRLRTIRRLLGRDLTDVVDLLDVVLALRLLDLEADS
jgi:hypothetical protein